MKFVNWIKKHIVGSFAILLGFIALVVSGSAFLASRSDFNAKLDNYNAQQEAAEALIAKAPKTVGLIDGFVTYSANEISDSKSSYKNYYLFDAHSATIAPLSEDKSVEYNKIDAAGTGALNEYMTALDRSGGAITFNIKAEEAGYADIAIEMASHWLDADNKILEIENITNMIKIQFNKLEVKTEDCALQALTEQAESFTTLVLGDVWLLKGNNTLTFTTSAYNDYKTDSNKILYVMPDIRNVSVMSSVTIDMPELA